MTVDEAAAQRILELYETASDNGSLISIEELLQLLPEPSSEGELARMLTSAPSLRTKLDLRAGYLTARSNERAVSESLAGEAESRARAKRNLDAARRFTLLVPGASPLLLGVSGSTSYRSASKSKDLDFFCVTRRAHLWYDLAKLLLLARAFRAVNPESPDLCFSCVMDVEYALSTFSARGGPLFARDALQTVVMKGDVTYGELLGRARWISELYPTLYRKRTLTQPVPSRRVEGVSALAAAANGFLFIVVGSYVRLKCFLRNRKLSKEGRDMDEFEALLGRDHLVYQSRRYRQMKESYEKVGKRDPPLGLLD